MKSVDRNLGGRNSWNTGTDFKLKMSTHASSHFATTNACGGDDCCDGRERRGGGLDSLDG